MLGPVLFTVGFGVAGWLAGEWAGAVVGVGVGLLVTAAVAVGAIVWAQQIGSLLGPEDALDNAPRPPGFRRLCDWVYDRTLSR